MEIKIIVAAHKTYRMPEDKIYLPVHVGAEGKKDENGKELNLGYVKDNTGENISVKNNSFCELTGLYWAWKNLEYDYLGLAHYRRHFMLKKKSKNPFENVLNEEEANKLAQKYKVIVPEKQKYYIETLYSHYKHTHYIETLDKAGEIIGDKYPEYVRFYNSVVKKRSGHMFNMFIMTKELTDSYCSWLFDILFELENRIGDMKMSAFQGRFYGRVSEILFNVWLSYQLKNGIISKKDVKAIPCIYMEKINWGRKIKSFLKAKFFHKKYESSF